METINTPDGPSLWVHKADGWSTYCAEHVPRNTPKGNVDRRSWEAVPVAALSRPLCDICAPREA